jgi:F0F1-type ATP synthase membrane subunit b/b'
MKIILGSIVMLIILSVFLWLSLSPLFRKIGSVAQKGSKRLEKILTEEDEENKEAEKSDEIQ